MKCGGVCLKLIVSGFLSSSFQPLFAFNGYIPISKRKEMYERDVISVIITYVRRDSARRRQGKAATNGGCKKQKERFDREPIGVRGVFLRSPVMGTWGWIR